MSRPDELIAGRYRLVERIAAGGMGSVWQAWDERLQRRVAVKKLHPNPSVEGDDALLAHDRALREARITARLHHPHAVPVYDVVDSDGQPCLIMQYLPSQSLNAVIAERGALTVAEVARIGGEVASALAAAHRAGIVHRDVKPGNVLVEPDGAAKITDFGISHALGDVSLTSTGIVTGTPAYLAPEVARGEKSTAASDVFSLGATLYAAVEGRPPFGSNDNPMATVHRVATGQIEPPRHAGALTAVLHQMLAAAARDRPSMDDAARILSAIAADPRSAASTQRLSNRPSLPPNRTMSLPAAVPHRATPAVPPSPPVRRDPTPLPPGRPPGPRPDPGRSRRRAGLVGAVVVALVAALAIVLVIGLSDSGSGGGGPTTVVAGPTGDPATPTTGRTSDRSRSTSASTRSTSTDAPSSAPSNNDTATPTAAQLIGAVSDYYGLLPDDTATAFDGLTTSYQDGHAGGQDGYDQFWRGFSSVSVSDLTADPPGTVTATVNYVRRDGSRTSERTMFGLVRQDGTLKINTSSVTG